MRWKLVRKDGKLDWEPIEAKRGRRSAQAKYGYHSYAMACNVEDVPTAQQKIIESGGRFTEYNEHGEPKVESRKHRNEICRALGYYDRNAGYGDAQTRNR